MERDIERVNHNQDILCEKNSVFNKSENEIDGKGMNIYIYVT